MRTLCIVLPETPHRTEAARKHFDERGMDVEFVWGVHGVKFGLFTYNRYMIDDPVNGWPVSQGAVAQHISQYNAWTICKHSPGEHFMILEDDAQFEPGWRERLDQALQDVPPDFDLLYVGSCCCANAPKQHIKGDIWHVEWPNCLHAYIIAKKAIPTMMSCHRKIWAPMDLGFIFDSLPKVKSYVVLPRMADQRNTHLDP